MERSLKAFKLSSFRKDELFQCFSVGDIIMKYLNEISLVVMGGLNGRRRHKCVKSMQRLVHIGINQSVRKS